MNRVESEGRNDWIIIAVSDRACCLVVAHRDLLDFSLTTTHKFSVVFASIDFDWHKYCNYVSESIRNSLQTENETACVCWAAYIHNGVNS